MEFIKVLMSSVRNLLGKKSTREILRYLTTVAMNYAENKYGIYPYKYDPMDIKNMVYHHNINSNDIIDPKELDKAINLFSIERFMNEMNSVENKNENKMDNFVLDLAKICNDGKLIETYNNMNDKNHILKLYDLDTLETSSIADSYEISSGGIYVPDRTIKTITNEGSMLADAKNDYLEKRLEMGENVKPEVLKNLMREYYNKINKEKVEEYFNGIM